LKDTAIYCSGGIKKMKSIFTLLLGGLLTTTAFANNITLNFSGNRNYQVLIDGRNVNASDYSGSNTIYLDHLRSGQHTIEVYRIKRSHGLFGNNSARTYSSYFNVSPQLDLNIVIDNRGSAQIYETRSNGGRGNGRRNRDRDWNNRDNGRRDGDWNNRDNGYGNGGYGHGNDGYGNGDRSNGYNRALSDHDFNQVLQKIRGQWFGKLGTARDAVNSNYFTTSQVRQILQVFSSENDQLELAKLSYTKLVDQQNFRQLYDLFSRRSQNELDNYIRDGR
jgi:hypothetical protein